MKKVSFSCCLAVFFSIFAMAFFSVASSAHASYQFYRTITVTSTASVASGTQANFPMLVSSTLASWEPSSDGGHIQNLCTAPNGNQEPCDFIFSSNNSCTSPLNFETESYTSSTGALIDWINVPSLSAGTAIYACYDNNAIKTDQSHPSSTWNSGYDAVYHLATVNGNLNASDSTQFARNLTKTGTVIPVTGQIDGAASTSFSSYLGVSMGNVSSTFTMEGWFREPGGNPNANAYDFMGYGDRFDTTNEEVDIGPQIGSTIVYFNSGGTQFNADSDDYSAGFIFVAGTYTSGHFATMYDSNVVNAGGLQITTSTVITSFTDSGLDRFTVGTDPEETNNFGGYSDEVRFSNVARSGDWITAEYYNESSPATFYALSSETSFATTSTPPQSLTATPSSTQVALSWSTPSSNGGSSLTNYIVDYKLDASSTFLQFATTTASQTTSTVTSLTNGSLYDFEVFAQNSVGSSTASNVVSSTPTAPIVINSFSASPSTITIGSASTLSWNISGTVATTTITGDALNLTTSTTSGTVNVTPDTAGTETYTLTALNVNMSSSTTTSITVNSAGGGGGGGSTNAPTVAVSSAYGAPYGLPATTTPPSPSSSSPAAMLSYLEQELQQLQAALNARGGTASTQEPQAPFTKDLFLHMIDPDVARLQNFLDTHGFPVNTQGFPGSLGHEINTFGLKTYQALLDYQASVGIRPTGYFGVITRGRVDGESGG